MKYNIGMYGGSFDPLHIGHISDIIRAASQCNHLYVIVSWSAARDFVPLDTRLEWINDCTAHLTNITIRSLEDSAPDKTAYNTDSYWEKGAADIKRMIGKKIDAVFCGSDYLGTGRFESLYKPDSEIVYFDRAEVPVSSTDIRTWATDHWDYIPLFARQNFCRRVLIVGTESCGKSTLVQNLALAYNTLFVPEIGRETSVRAGGDSKMVLDDFLENIYKQKEKTEQTAALGNRLIFVDTDALTTQYYAEILLSNPADIAKCQAEAQRVNRSNHWDLVLLLRPDNPFVQDGYRNESVAADRMKYHKRLANLLTDSGVTFHEIGGDYLQIFNSAKTLIQAQLNISTKF